MSNKDILWEEFTKTGSIGAYLLYKRLEDEENGTKKMYRNGTKGNSI